MNKRLASSPDFVIRHLETPEEIDTYFQLNAKTFRPDEDTALVASRRRRFIMHDPDFQRSQLHSAFYGQTYIGSYRLHERRLSIESVQFPIGCVGGVVTHPAYQHQGVATAMMLDALAVARDRQYALLLLHGVADYYKQHGYIDVCEDMPQHAIQRALIPGDTSPGYIVRAIEQPDAPALLALYRQHHETSLCSFAPSRTLARQAHYLENWPEEAFPLLALNAQGAVEGYLLLSRRRGRLNANEVAANTWPAALALLQEHHRLLEAEGDTSSELYWPLPFSDITLHLLADHLPVRSEMESYPDGGWMARVANSSALLPGLLRLWHARWQQSRIDWAGRITIEVDERVCSLELSPGSTGGIRLVDAASDEGHHIALSQQVLTQLAFGFRSATWAAGQAGQRIPDELIPVLEVLFPLRQSWIAGTDQF